MRCDAKKKKKRKDALVCVHARESRASLRLSRGVGGVGACVTVYARRRVLVKVFVQVLRLGPHICAASFASDDDLVEWK